MSNSFYNESMQGYLKVVKYLSSVPRSRFGSILDIGADRTSDSLTLGANWKDKVSAMDPVTQIQIRCSGCNRRLGDFVNEIEAGQVILEVKCPKCGQPHMEVIRQS